MDGARILLAIAFEEMAGRCNPDSGCRAIWVVMDETGMKPGNVMLDIDATSGAVVGKTKQ